MLQTIGIILRAFDAWGEPIGGINIHGQTKYKTKFGGCIGFAISTIISAFTITRF